ncbi:gluconokinase [Agarilytica rhodophyticola]|uniref:gluconokinase n=1 Tax=Agarilytica rhodophyticola TaxID=1737490 RepID=UPI000B342727|nr:gluconokinase [Agarilytica rhodophyticola]
MSDFETDSLDSNKSNDGITAVIVAGVSGSGKSTIGHALAEALDWAFYDADAFHSPTAVAKMSAGEPLNDEDRLPWLSKLNTHLKAKPHAILACSALTEKYRQILCKDLACAFVWLNITPEEAERRVAARESHFMPASLVQSQFSLAELPKGALNVDATLPVDDIVTECIKALSLPVPA